MSTTTADIIYNQSGNLLYHDGYPRQPGRVIEYLSSPCDGSVMTGQSGAWTTQTVATTVAGSATYTPVLGSSIDYCPPPGTAVVIYRYTFSVYWVAAHAISHWKFWIDGNEVLYARHNRSGQYIEYRYTFEWPIVCNAAATDYNYGRLASWTQPRNLYLSWRWYGGSNYPSLNSTYYWDGASAIGVNFCQPEISIIAIA